MIQKRNLRLVLSSALLVALLLALVLPFAVHPEAYAAPPVVPDKDTWVNTYSGSYYDNLNTDLTGTAFREQLKKLITDTHTVYTTYNDGNKNTLKNVWAKSDVADPKNPNNGQIKWFYTGTVTSASNFGGNVGQTNREHVWAKNSGSTFGSSWAEAMPGADAHHLRPTECQLNSSRGNLGFDEVPQTSSNAVLQNRSTSYGSGDGLCYRFGSFFYPAKGYRGATARILFYMQVRWGDYDTCKLKFTDGPTSSDGKSIGKISTLLKWHIEEPPNEDEIYRNNVVAGIQGNRNPFIDHPEFAEMIYCNNGESYSNTLRNVVAQYGSYLDEQPTPPPVDDKPTALTLSPSSLSLTVGGSATVSVTAAPSGASNQVTWSTSNGSVASVANGVVTAVGAGTATVTATSVAAPSVQATLSVTVTQAATPDPPTPPKLESLAITPSEVSITQGGTRQLSVTASPSGASSSVSWSSSNTSAVTVSAQGLVTGVSEGEAIITATSTEDPQIKATVTVRVVSQAVNTQAFNDAMSTLESATTLSERYNALNRAIEAYNNMDAAAKAAVATEYAALQQAVEQYNNEIAGYNEELASATSLASQAVALSLSSAFLAIFAIVIKRMGR